MSKLEAIESATAVIEKVYLVYRKSEADKVIAELEENHKKEVGQLLILNREQVNAANRLRDSMEQALRHQKYKRCLAMARMCEERYYYLTSLENYQMTDKEYRQVIGDYWDRWLKRWLKIAEQFKEGDKCRG